MSKKRYVTIILALIFVIMLTIVVYSPDIVNIEQNDQPPKHFGGVWVASVMNIDFPKSQQEPVAKLKAELSGIVQNVKKAGLCAIFFQVRPTADALYKSEIYPWSHWLTGVQGKAPAMDFDPLSYLCQIAKEKGIQVHAWINPYRVTNVPDMQLSELSENNPAVIYSELVRRGGDGKLYFDPGEPQSEQIVVKGVKELIDNYDIAGIHFDDYFYPSTDFDDAATYEKYGNGLSKEDWRRQNTYNLIKEVYETVKSSPKNLEFGVSPVGIWQNSTSDPKGSDTKGYEGYSAVYADTYKWVKDEIVDYIVPQIYWNRGYEFADYEILENWWAKVVEQTKVKLYIGHGAYKVGDWENPNELQEQVKSAMENPNVSGSVFYNYSYFTGNLNNIYKDICDLFEAEENELTVNLEPLIVGVPAYDSTIGSTSTFIIGKGDPRAEIIINGEKASRSEKGFFSSFVNLSKGKNQVEIKYNGQTKLHVINVAETYKNEGGGDTTVPTNKKSNLIGTVKADNTVMRVSYSTVSDRITPLAAGVTDQIVEESPSYYKLRYGGWTLKNNLKTESGKLTKNLISKVGGKRNEDSTDITFEMPVFAPYTAKNINGNMVVTIHNTVGAKAFNMAVTNPLFGSINFEQKGNNAVYTLSLKNEGNMYGYKVSYENGVMTVTFKHKKALKEGSKPLSGITVVLDAGHGGSDIGAIGPLGSGTMTEAELNLSVVMAAKKKIENAGGTVVLTRRDNSYVSLDDRVAQIKGSGADISLSIHHNSVDYSRDVREVYGAVTLYSEDFCWTLAATLQDSLVKETGRFDRGVKRQGLAVCRITECPAILMEMGFMTNIYDFEELSDEAVIEKEAEAILKGINNFFS